jgi:hypothetical protein
MRSESFETTSIGSRYSGVSKNESGSENVISGGPEIE